MADLAFVVQSAKTQSLFFDSEQELKRRAYQNKWIVFEKK